MDPPKNGVIDINAETIDRSVRSPEKEPDIVIAAKTIGRSAGKKVQRTASGRSSRSGRPSSARPNSRPNSRSGTPRTKVKRADSKKSEKPKTIGKVARTESLKRERNEKVAQNGTEKSIGKNTDLLIQTNTKVLITLDSLFYLKNNFSLYLDSLTGKISYVDLLCSIRPIITSPILTLR